MKTASKKKKKSLIEQIIAAEATGVPKIALPYLPEDRKFSIEKEYELIKQNKSKLCESSRNWVVRQFESNNK